MYLSKIEFVFCTSSSYNCIGFWLNVIMQTMMRRRGYLFRFAWPFFLALFVCGCVGKMPDDDVALIKVLLARLERGIDQKSTAVLDSITLDKKLNLASRLLDSLSSGGKLQSARIISKMFVVVKDSAEVRLKLGLSIKSGHIAEGQEPGQVEKPLNLWLTKKRGRWKINGFSTASIGE
jgi:hypothetical protein